MNVKMRNDNNTVVKSERVSVHKETSRESLKENIPENISSSQKRKSPDEEIQAATESDSASSKRSSSVEIICPKTVEIDITSGSEADKMPPPPVPAKKCARKPRTKQNKALETMSEAPVQGQLRVTRSKIKQEKLSISTEAASQQQLVNESTQNEPNANKTANVTKKSKKVKFGVNLVSCQLC
jgi:hypothetical protein